MSLRIDHVIYAVEDLDVAGARFRADFGLGSVAGGRHPTWGTANRIVPLGRDYVELVTVVDRDVAAASDFGRPVLDAIASGRPLVGWAAQTDDLQAIANRLGLEVGRGSRARPDGSVLAWRLAGVAPALAAGALPFFIEWDVPADLQPERPMRTTTSSRSGSRRSRSRATSTRCTRGSASRSCRCASSTARRRFPQ